MVFIREIPAMRFSASSARTVVVLAITQLIGWGTTFESIGVLGRRLAPDLGFANEIAFAGLSVMMLVSAFSSPLVGAALERLGAARVLAIGSLLFAVGLIVLSLCVGIVSYMIAWAILGVGGAFGLSAPAYAAVVEREGAGSPRMLGILMLFTGLSATISWPLLSVAEAELGWRISFVLAAAAQVVICTPLYLFGLPQPIDYTKAGTSIDVAPVAFTSSGKKLAFLLVALTTAISSFVTYGLSPSLLEVLHQSGATPELALQLAAARGVLGISARAIDMALGKRGNPFLTTTVGTSLMIASFLCLLILPASTLTLWVFITLYGFGSGILVVARALLPLALFSPREYGRQSTRLALPQNIANAAAPIIYTALLDRTGIATALVSAIVLAASALASVLLLIGLVRRTHAARMPTPGLS